MPHEGEANAAIPVDSPAHAVRFEAPQDISRAAGWLQFTIVATLSGERPAVQQVLQNQIRVACRVHGQLSTSPCVAEAFGTTEAAGESSIRCQFKVKLSALRSDRASLVNVGIILQDSNERADWNVPGAWFVIAAGAFDVFADYFSHFNADRG